MSAKVGEDDCNQCGGSGTRNGVVCRLCKGDGKERITRCLGCDREISMTHIHDKICGNCKSRDGYHREPYKVVF